MALPAGKVGASAKLKSCIACHESTAENDYVFVHEVGS
jgi:cytochrome c553